MANKHNTILFLAGLTITIEAALLFFYHPEITQWIQHHLWVILIPFTKAIIKKLAALNIIAIFNGAIILIWHLLKLGIIKVLKTVGIRYGLFFSQYRWRWIRKSKIIFLRRGKQIYRKVSIFWNQYSIPKKIIIMAAFFPIIILLFLLGMSFNITRKTIVRKTQEAAMVKIATNASQKSLNVMSVIIKADSKIIHRIKKNQAQRIQKIESRDKDNADN